MMLATWAAVALTQSAPSFAAIEKSKYEAFAALTSFSGTYEVMTIPKDGAGSKQTVSILIAPTGRLTRIVSNGLPQFETAWTKAQRWTVFYPERRYSLAESSTDLPLTLPYAPLAAEPGSINFTMDQSGVRFAADPAPTVSAPVKETVEGKSVRKIVCSSRNQSTGGEMSISQWFDGEGWQLRRFELVLKSKGAVALTIRGNLVSDTPTPTVSESSFRLPDSIRQTFTRSGL